MTSIKLLSTVSAALICFLTITCVIFCYARFLNKKKRLSAYKNRRNQGDQVHSATITHINFPTSDTTQANNISNNLINNQSITPNIYYNPNAPNFTSGNGFQISSVSQDATNIDVNAPPPSYSEVVQSNQSNNPR